MKKYTVVSLFDGIGCGRVALERAGIPIKRYFASEIKKPAIKCAKLNNPDIIEIGDVTKVHYEDGWLFCEPDGVKRAYEVGKIDLLIGGSPCQDFSFAASTQRKSQNGAYGLKGSKSKLFYEYLRLKEEINPKYFLLENVNMKKESEADLNAYMKVTGLHIDSSLVSFQTRHRIYWTNLPHAKVPEDRHINFQDYKDNDCERLMEAKVNGTPSREKMWNNGEGMMGLGTCRNITHAQKVGCLLRKQDRSPNSGLIEFGDFCRFLTRREMELAQTLPAGYCDSLSFNQVQDVTGDGWIVEVIAWLFEGLKGER